MRWKIFWEKVWKYQLTNVKFSQKNFKKYFGGKIVIGKHLKGNIIEEGRNEKQNKYS
jgi:hypothetical protein